MGFVVLPLLRLGSSMFLLLLLLFLLNSALIFADNLPGALYSPNDYIHTCRCFENTAGIVDCVPFLHIASASYYSKLENFVLYFGRGNAIATAVILMITLLNVIVYKLREFQEEGTREINKPDLSMASEHSCRKYSLSEVELATHNFDEAFVIGRGGFGKVYKGLINHGASVVAIKRLDSKSKQGASEFWTEIKMLSKLRHSHLVTLFGYCNDYGEMILVYEYVSGGNLRDHLYKSGKPNGSSSLSWEQRLKICLGAARALDYLHTSTGVQHRVIHRDVKTSNILLDENWCPKISDFGVSKIGPLNQPFTHVSTDVKGSFGYFDPEYFLTRKLTRKSDVYAFGVVLFEVLFARPAVDLSLEEERRGLAAWGPQSVKEGLVEQNIDPNLRGQILSDCLTIYAKIASQCLQSLPRKRPTMSEVVFKLETALGLHEMTDYSEIEGEIDTAGIHDNQEKEKPSVVEEVINAGNGESSSERITRSLKMSARRTRFSRMLPQFFSVKDHVPVSGDARSRGSLAKSTGIAPFSRMLGQFFSAHGDEKSSKKSRINYRSNQYTKSTDEDLRPSKDGGVPLEVPNLKVFTLAELKKATRNFRPDTALGEGGFGSVYKGWVSDNTCVPAKKFGIGMPVAIKKLKLDSWQGFREWMSEVIFLGKLKHPNLINLWGYCQEGEEHLLVYEYMPNGSFDNHLFRRRSGEPLPWDTRISIITGAARGLLFLHTCEKPIIYRDFKCSNILLDEDFNAKLSDFGLSRDVPEGDGTHISTQVMGTYGYAAPEYIATGHLTVKSDVYSFGVVLLETLTGRRVVDQNQPTDTEKQNLLEWARPFLTKKRGVEKILDPLLKHECPINSAYQIAMLALKCINSDRKVRPSMENVLEKLEQISIIEMEPRT